VVVRHPGGTYFLPVITFTRRPLFVDDEAREMLGEIRGRFTEESDTADLKDAKALLEESGV
jgi:hypothetical protein